MIPAGFKPMRSCAPDEKFPLEWPMLGSFKLDGIRLSRISDRLVTKSGKQLPNRHVRHWALINMPQGLDFEVISGLPNTEETYNRTYRAVMTVEGEPDFTMYVFDICEAEGPAGGYAIDRYNRVKELCKPLVEQFPGKIVVVEKRWLHSQEQMEAMYQEALDSGYEGLILQSPDGHYKWGKCTAKERIQLKLKPENDAEAIVTGFYEAEENQNTATLNDLGETVRSSHQENKVGKGTLGGFLARDVATGKDLRVPCGKMKHGERLHVWQNQASYMGQPFTYRSMGYGVKDLPRQLRWYRWRSPVDMEANSADA